MAKMRVYEYAKALNVSSKEILTALKNMDLEVNNHITMLEEKLPLKSLMPNIKKAQLLNLKSQQKRTKTNSHKGLISNQLEINQIKFETERRMTCRIINLTKTRRITTTKKINATTTIIKTNISKSL